MDTQEHNYTVVTDANFDTEVNKFNGVVVVDFWAEWCGPCRAIAPFVQKIADDYKDNKLVKVAKLDTDSNPGVAMQYHVMSIPTVKFIVGGQIVDELNGFMGPATGVVLEDKLKSALAKLPTQPSANAAADLPMAA